VDEAPQLVELALRDMQIVPQVQLDQTTVLPGPF
jgi:hypothetical protein